MKLSTIKPVRVLRETSHRLRHKYLDSFVFIHINKTGGSSIEKALQLPLEHKTALEKIAEIGIDQWNKKFTFAVIRNPWDKVVSHYHYRVQRNRTNLGTNRIDFKEWVQLAYRDQSPVYYDVPKMFMPQSDWISDRDGKILCNFVGRFENLEADFQSLCNRLGKKASLPHVKSSKRENYQDYYDAQTVEIIRAHFRKDIENFGYQFQ